MDITNDDSLPADIDSMDTGVAEDSKHNASCFEWPIDPVRVAEDVRKDDYLPADFDSMDTGAAEDQEHSANYFVWQSKQGGPGGSRGFMPVDLQYTLLRTWSISRQKSSSSRNNRAAKASQVYTIHGLIY